MWSWRESNPCPNEETIRFLHAYLRLGFRASARPKPPTVALSVLVSLKAHGRSELSPIYLHLYTEPLQGVAFERCLVPTPSEGIKLIYYTSIKQRERNYFRQLKFCCLRLQCKPTTHYMLTNHFCPLSKPVSPLICGTKIRIIFVPRYILS